MSIDISGVEGLEALDSHAIVDPLRGSKFSLPASFNARKYASKWEEEGPAINEAMQRQVLESANCSAAGWSVFKVEDIEKTAELMKKAGDEALQKQQEEFETLQNEETDPVKKAKIKKPALKVEKVAPVMVPYVRAVGKKIFVLMFRPSKLQRAVNAIYADQSRQRTRMEVKESTSLKAEDPEGILTQHDLNKFSKSFNGDEDNQELNYLPNSAGGKTTRLEEAADAEIN